MALVWDKALFDELYEGRAWTTGFRFKPGVKPKSLMFNYHWSARRAATNYMFSNLLAIPRFTSASNIAIIGGAFGWTAEAIDGGNVTSFSVDTSPYVLETNQTSEESELRECLQRQGHDPDDLSATVEFIKEDGTVASEQEVWDYWLRADISSKRSRIPVEAEDMVNEASRRAVRNRGNGALDIIVTELILESPGDDDGALQIIEHCEQLRPNPSCVVAHMVYDGGGSADDQRFNWKTREEWKTFLETNGFEDHLVLNRGQLV